MNREDFERIESVFNEIVLLGPAARAQALDESCADRPDLRAEIGELLDAHDRLGAAVDDIEAQAHLGVGLGSELGAFRLVERIGEGGMGEVFRAQRIDGAYQQEVAIKVMRETLVGADLLRRFKVERQILASLRHPNIVTLLDGGATPGGQAFLAMEYVDGVGITTYCRAGNLSLEARLQLFRLLCGAVQYAHQHGIVHRDLKPANILVRPDGVLKVLDFGVAKLLQGASDAQEATRGMLPGPLTPNYASPEQLRGLPVTTASDVYALGVLLFELLTDLRPYQTEGLTLDRVLDLVVRAEPPRPSAAGSDRRLRGDLDAIVLKAMSKEPEGRYDSAGALGSDIARYLASEPVTARVPSAGYLFRRLAVRNKSLVGVSAFALLFILAAAGVAWWQREVAQREQARAEQRFRDVRQLANALVFKIHDAVAPLAGSTPVRRTIVSEALAYLERLEREAGDDVTLRVELAAAYRQIGAILGDPQTANLGDRDGAIAQHEKARALLLPLATDDAPFEVVFTLRRVDGSLSTLYNLRHDTDRALAIAREAVDLATRYRERHAEDERGLETLAAAMFQLAWSSPLAERRSLWERTLDHYERLLEQRPASLERQRNVALVEKYLAGLLPKDESVTHWQRAADLDEKRLAAMPGDRQAQLDTAISLAGLADMQINQGKVDEALRVMERSVLIRRGLVETDPTNVQVKERLGYALAHVSALHVQRGAGAAGRPPAREAVDILQDVFDRTKDRSAQDTLAYAWLQLGHVERAVGDPAAACRAFRRAVSIYAGTFDPSSNDVNSFTTEAAREAAACQ